MDAFIQMLRNIGAVRLGTMAFVAMVLIGFFIFLTTRLAAPNLALLYGELDPADTGQVIAQLEAQKVPYEVQKGGKEILVPSDKVGELRLSLAGQGLPTKGSPGYELFDREEKIGTSSAVQELNRLRALEGEIARTISAVTMVKGARVHLVLPRRQLFSRDRQEASASIVLRMRGAARLSREQVFAIQHLVAAAVPDLQPNRISIVDDRGTLLARGGDAEGTLAGGFAPDELQANFETRLNGKLTDLLERALGFGKVRAEVRADIDFDRVTTNQETYDPEGQVVRSTQTVEESSRERDGPPDAVTVGQNLPDAGAAGGDGQSEAATNRIEEATNFEISRTIRNHVREIGKVNRIWTSVLVDEKSVTDADGQTTYQPRSEEELEQIGKLVRSAIGFDEDRGDVVEVVSMRFADPPEAFTDADLNLVLGLNKADLLRGLEAVVLGVVGILIIMLVLRPLISNIFEAAAANREQLAPAGAGGAHMLTDQRGGAPALAGPGGNLPATMTAGGMAYASGGGGGGEVDESMIDLANIEGRVKTSSLRKIAEIIDRHPEEAVSIMRNWMYQER